MKDFLSTYYLDKKTQYIQKDSIYFNKEYALHCFSLWSFIIEEFNTLQHVKINEL